MGVTRRGMTLVELVVSLAIVSVLVLSMGSAVVLATRAIPATGAVTDDAARVQSVLNDLTSELQFALHIASAGTNHLSFIVPDRDGDGGPERIRYAWDGPGRPVTRSFNGGPAQTVLERVDSVRFGLDEVTVPETYPGYLIVGPKEELASHQTLADPKSEAIEPNRATAQLITPSTVPERAVSWTLEEAWFEAVQDDLLQETILAQVRRAAAEGTPAGPVLAQVSFLETTLPWGWSDIWQRAAYANPPSFSPGESAAVVLTYGGLVGRAGRVRYDGGVSSGTQPRSRSTDGATWQLCSGERLRYRVLGRWTTRSPDQTVVRAYRTAAHVELRTAPSAPTYTVATRMLNTPETLVGLWETDFSSNPTTFDGNGDGVADWAIRGGGLLNLAALGDGALLDLAGELETRPLVPLGGPTTLRIRFENTAELSATEVWLNADWATDGLAAPLYARLTNELLGSKQTLVVYRKKGNGTSEPLVTVGDLPQEWVDLRLLVDPAMDTVNVRVNGVPRGTFLYERVAIGAGEALVTLKSSVGSRFDSVSVRVGGGTP